MPATEATPPGALTVAAPVKLSTYLAEAPLDTVRSFVWGFRHTDELIPGLWTEVLLGTVDPSGVEYGWDSAGTGTILPNQGNSRSLQITTSSDSRYFSLPSTSRTSNPLSDNATGNTVGFNLRVVSNTGAEDILVKVQDGTREEEIIITTTEVELKNTGFKYTFDTTDIVHEYSFTMKGDAVRLFVDGVLRITGTNTAATSTNAVTFGHGINAPSTAVSRWVLFRYIPGALDIIDKAFLEFELQIDSENTFSSPNLRTFTTTSDLVNLQQGCLVSSYEVRIPPRQLYIDLTEDQFPDFHWRVRVIGGEYSSVYTDGETYQIDKNEELDIFNRVFEALPDENAYDKDASSSNVAVLMKGQSQEIDLQDFENIRTKRDFFWDEVRESRTQDVLGVLVGTQNTGQTSAEYKWQVREVLSEFFNKPTTVKTMKDMTAIFTGRDPDIIEQYTLTSWILDSNTGGPYIKDPAFPLLAPIIKLRSQASKAFSWDLHIFDPYGCDLDGATLNNLVDKFKPAHTQVFTFIYSQEGVIRLPACNYGEGNYGEAGCFYVDKRFTL
jgi:hypothetical protein